MFLLFVEGGEKKKIPDASAMCLPPPNYLACSCVLVEWVQSCVSQSANMLAERTAFALWKYSHFIVCRFDIKCLLGATSHFEDAHAG